MNRLLLAIAMAAVAVGAWGSQEGASVRVEAVVTGYRPQAMHDHFDDGRHAVYDAVEFTLAAPREWKGSKLVAHFAPGEAVAPFRNRGVRCTFEIDRQYLIRPSDDAKTGGPAPDAPLFEGALENLTVAEDRIVVTRVSGGPPLLSADGRPVEPSRTVVADLRGARFEAVRKDVEAALALLGKDRTWWDVGPDASFLSAEITLGTNRYTLNSWFPLERDNPRIAVSENRGMVAVSGTGEKGRIEGGNGERYRTLTGIFEKALAVGAKPPAAASR